MGAGIDAQHERASAPHRKNSGGRNLLTLVWLCLLALGCAGRTAVEAAWESHPATARTLLQAAPTAAPTLAPTAVAINNASSDALKEQMYQVPHS